MRNPQSIAVNQSAHQRRIRLRFGSSAGTMSRAAWYGHHRLRIGMMNENVAIIGPRRAGRPDDHAVLAAR